MNGRNFIVKNFVENSYRYRESSKNRNDFTQLWRQWPCVL